MNLRLLVVAGLAAGSLAVPAAPASAVYCVVLGTGASTCPSQVFPLCASTGGSGFCLQYPFGPPDSALTPVCVTAGTRPVVCVTDD